MMIFFSLYFPILLSLSLSFFIHAFNKHIHSFFSLISTTFNNTSTNYKLLQKKCHNPMSCTAPTVNVDHLPPPPLIGLTDNVHGGIGGLVTCTESLGFESFEIENDDGDDNNIIHNNSDDDEVEEEGGGAAPKGREEDAFPPPLSSLDGNGQPSFVLLPVRKDGRLQLSKVRVKRPEILRATRQDGRLRLYLVPDEEFIIDDDVEQEEETEEVGVETGEETEEVVEMISRYYEEEEEEEEEEEDRVREREFPARGRGNEWFRGCHQVVHHIQCHQHVHSSSHHHNHHLRMYGVGIA